MSKYATFEDISNFDTTVSMLGDVFQAITGMSSYVTSGTLRNNYVTQLELSEKVDYTVFEQQLNISRDSAISNSYAYTDNKFTSYITSFSPLSGTCLSILGGANTYQLSGSYLTDSSVFQSSGNYLTNASAFQLSGNYLTNAPAFQLSGNYLTDASVFQAPGNYITTFTPLAETYLSILGAGSTYQTKADMGSYVTSGSIVTNYQTRLSYITASSGFSGSYVPLLSKKVSVITHNI